MGRSDVIGLICGSLLMERSGYETQQSSLCYSMFLHATFGLYQVQNAIVAVADPDLELKGHHASTVSIYYLTLKFNGLA